MEKRYQVFISSTFEDLKEERNEVVQALLELDCIPCGMEYFPASNDTQWEFIKRLIDDCDYYIVIIAGRYGSVDSDGISYTQKEYEYAVSKGIPAIGFIHGNPESITLSKAEKDPKKKKKLDEFKGKVQGKLCKHWASAKDLGGVVSRSMIQEIKRNPRVGWIKANSVDTNAEKTILTLYKRIEELEAQLKSVSKKPFDFAKFFNDTEDLSQGEDEITLKAVVTYGDWNKKKQFVKLLKVTWNQLTYLFFPKLLSPIRDTALKTAITKSLTGLILEDNKFSEKPNLYLTLSDESFETLKIQLLSLGYIEPFVLKEDEAEKPIKKVRLTELGEQILLRQRALKK